MASLTPPNPPIPPTQTPHPPLDEIFCNNSTPPTLSLYNSTVTILVGPQQTTFTMHKGLLCHHSPFFTAAFTGPYQESASGLLLLATEDPTLFSLFNHWAYAPISILRSLKPLALIDLYAFAESRLIRRLQNDIVDTCIWRAMQDDSMDDVSLGIAWRQSWRLRPLLVDLFIGHGELEGAWGLDAEFVRAVAVRSTELARGAVGRDEVPGGGVGGGGAARCVGLLELRCCRFHVHEGEDSVCGDEG